MCVTRLSSRGFLTGTGLRTTSLSGSSADTFSGLVGHLHPYPYYDDHPLCPRCPHPGACDDDCEQVQHASIRQAVALFVILTAALATVSFIKVIFCIFIYCQYIAVSFTKVTQSADSQTIYLHQPGIVSGRHPQTHKSKTYC